MAPKQGSEANSQRGSSRSTPVERALLKSVKHHSFRGCNFKPQAAERARRARRDLKALGNGPHRAQRAVHLATALVLGLGQDEAFLENWERARAILSSQPGYLSTRLHRSLSPTAEFRFVNVALRRSAESFRAATSCPEFKNAPVPFRFHAALYEVVREDDQ